MARIALIVGAAVAGAVISVATGFLGTFAVGAWASDIIAGAAVGASVGSTIGSLVFRGPQPPVPIANLQVSASVPGSPIPIGYGTVRIGGQLIWCPGIIYTTNTNSPPRTTQ